MILSALKRTARSAIGLVPYDWRFGGAIYRRLLRELDERGRVDEERLADAQSESLRWWIGHAVETVPFYGRLFAEAGLSAASIREPRDLARLPFLDKETVRAAGESLASRAVPRGAWVHTATGGTSGRPLGFYVERRVSRQREWAFMHTQWKRVGYALDARVAALRNHVLPPDRLYEYNPRTRTLVLDPFRLTPRNVRQYVEAMRRHEVRFLHTYPSAAATLLRFAAEAGVDPRSGVRVVLASSENVYPGQREGIERGLDARFFSWYGHSEQLVLAGECAHDARYHAFPQYGVLELIDDAGRVIEQDGVMGEIVGTGFNNRVMPFLRYCTGDFARYAPGRCTCGLPYRRIESVAGRWRQEMIVTADGGLVSMTALNMHSDCFDRVRQFQFVQEEPGVLELHLVPAEQFAEADEAQLARELGAKLGTTRLVLRRVEEIARTERGKHRFLIQRLPIDLGGGA
ncbi:MAG: phenylacetate--CoA ligase family protein [Candidatus Eisenbacteria bacterium]